jgi:hypothetical protein
MNPAADVNKLGQYYLTLGYKAQYAGPFDSNGIPMLDYLGDIGVQYNPTAIAQYALGNYNLGQASNNGSYQKFLQCAEWLRDNLAVSPHGTYLWYYNFDFFPLKAPWYSGLAQGEGLSVLVRAYAGTGEEKFAKAAHHVFQSLCRTIGEGGALFREGEDYWIEEGIDPPSHVLNGFISALWGVHDYFLLTKSPEAGDLFQKCSRTLTKYLPRYDLGFWSIYKLLPPKKIKSIASPNYHRLHITQLRVMQLLTDQKEFGEYADRWENYSKNALFRNLAIAYKIISKMN